MVKQFVKAIIKNSFIITLIGIIYLLNSNFIEGNIFFYVGIVPLYKFINAIILLAIIFVIILFGKTISKILKNEYNLLSRLSKIAIWSLAFTIVFFTENLNYVIAENLYSIIYFLNVNLLKSEIVNYILIIEIILIAIPIIKFLFFLYKNIDNYTESIIVKSKSVLKNKNHQ